MVDLKKMPFVYWSKKTIINYLQDRILVWSILYYDLDVSVIPDYIYDRESHDLLLFMQQHPGDAKLSRYWYVFSDFDANTGADLAKHLKKDDYKRLLEKAMMVANK